MTLENEPQPVELRFLAEVYAGFNKSTITTQQFQELSNQLLHFPAQSLARKIKNPNLNQLRKTLFELNIHDDLIKILQRKYFQQVQENSSTAVSVDKYMRDLQLDKEIQEVVPW